MEGILAKGVTLCPNTAAAVAIPPTLKSAVLEQGTAAVEDEATEDGKAKGEIESDVEMEVARKRRIDE